MSAGSRRLTSSSRDSLHVGVIGASECDAELARLAEEVGRGIAQAGAVLVCGGMGGVMEAACRGAKQAGGLTVGILPGPDRAGANACVDVAIASGIGEARNLAIIRTADVLIAVGGSYGTLSEIGFALRMGKRVVGLKTWDIEGIVKTVSPAAALRLATAAD
ncbi:TIGR00725 family protein [candidate division WOR-3 bacterium]|nr:TIGR00725 family protein [candidate division WOR-3 bacterium]